MKNIIRAGSLILVLSFALKVFSQIPNGAWRDHFSYISGKSLAITPNKVYCGIKTGGIICYDKVTGEREKISKVTGLSDIDINCLHYSSENNVLIIGYTSGNIDLILSDSKINIPDIKRKQLTVNKTINKIKTYGNLAYLACDFGIVVLDLQKREIKDSYFFGPNGTSIQVNDLTIYNEEIYAATELGLYKAGLKGTNLLDYSVWKQQTGFPGANSETKRVESFNDKLVVVYKNIAGGRDEIIYNEGNNWNSISYPGDTLINNLDVTNSLLSIAGEQISTLYNSNLQVVSSHNVITAGRMLQDEDGTIYFASGLSSLVRYNGSEYSSISINGPYFNPYGQVAAKGEHLWITSGGPNNIYGIGGGYDFYNEKWNSVISGADRLKDVGNFYKIAFHPDDNRRIFVSGFLYGIFEINNFEVINEYRYDNTPIFQSTVGPEVGVRAMGLDFDSKGNLWTVFEETDQPVYVLRNTTDWENPRLYENIFSKNQSFIDLLVTETDQVWILSRKLGIVVLKEEPDGTILEKNFPLKNQDNESISAAYCLAEDKNGNVWVGTNKGPIFYPAMRDIFERTNITGNSIKIPRGDGTEFADYLLDYEVVNDIAIDGANRKWLATENSGVFLVSDDGLKTLHQFTVDNSSLISNNVISVGVQEKTGEVFFSTNKGVVSFMGTATEGLDDFKDVYVYPNPVRPGYEGDITITGLIEEASVKVTDISGNLVYETTSLGGQAVWDGKNFDGKRVNTGVYLVFMTNDDGSKTHITKLVFIH